MMIDRVIDCGDDCGGGGRRKILPPGRFVGVHVVPPLHVVQIEGLAILQIIKRCKDLSPSLVTGQLLGLDVGSVLEVTNCFPFPTREEDNEVKAEGTNYQLKMMRYLREVNVDNNTVGWYQSTLFGSYQIMELIETFMNYQVIMVSNDTSD
ncbi:hypothetical protein MLD38_035655 [Melastoma candidum]|uniref:Uncharacterized protein n=1 Tax=Melastoma candidum TaxID=119954 RepID=A0ACB9LJ43_9MYRT|nr:hypothetical protein MLD38_035655 [Melastoma candidum]